MHSVRFTDDTIIQTKKEGAGSRRVYVMTVSVNDLILVVAMLEAVRCACVIVNINNNSDGNGGGGDGK